MPRNFSGDVITINFRIPRKLHRQLEQIAKRKTTSMNAEVVERLLRSIELDKWPKVEEMALALALQAAKFPEGDLIANRILDDLGQLLGDNRPSGRVAGVLNKLLAWSGWSIAPPPEDKTSSGEPKDFTKD
jgi:hypothetical protein